MVSWLAVKDVPPPDVLDFLSFEETGQEVLPGAREDEFCCQEMPDGWFVVFSEDVMWAKPKKILEVSQLGLVVGCQFEDKVEMTSMSMAARDGVELWSVFHNTKGSHLRLDVTGEPPAAFEEIRQRLFREQAEADSAGTSVDYIHDIPTELAAAVCGYNAQTYEPPFRALRPVRRRRESGASATNGGWLAKLFGRGRAPA
jgi:hypothetical protein